MDESRSRPSIDYKLFNKFGKQEGDEVEKVKKTKTKSVKFQKMATEKKTGDHTSDELGMEEGEIESGAGGEAGAAGGVSEDLVEKAEKLAEKAAEIGPDDPQFEEILAQLEENKQLMEKEAQKRAKMAALQDKMAEMEQVKLRLSMAREDEKRAIQERAEGYEFNRKIYEVRQVKKKKEQEEDRLAMSEFGKLSEWYKESRNKVGAEMKTTREQFDLLKELARDSNLTFCPKTGVAKLKCLAELPVIGELEELEGIGDTQEEKGDSESFSDLFRKGGTDKLSALGFGKWGEDPQKSALAAMPKPWQKKLEGKLPVDEDGECVETCCNCRHKNKQNKSGRLDKPSTNVKRRLEWPHMHQNKRYITKAMMFEELPFELFVGGEVRIILNCDRTQAYGRLRVLEQCAYWLDKCKDWGQVRSIYTAIIESLETGEADWGSEYYHYDSLLVKAQKIPEKDKPKAKKGFEYFCREYNRGECTITAPHRAWVKGEMRKVLHCCASCLRKEKEVRPHPQTDSKCPNKESNM